MKIILLSIIIFLSCLPVRAQTTPKKQFPIAKPDIFVSIARTTPINQLGKWKAQDWNGEFIIIFPVKNTKFAFQAEIIKNFTLDAPLVRFAVSYQVKY